MLLSDIGDYFYQVLYMAGFVVFLIGLKFLALSLEKELGRIR
jgi:hypothetical protein